MKGDKRLGKGLEDVSHLFLTAPQRRASTSPVQKHPDSHPADQLFPRVVAITGDHRCLEKSFLVSNLSVELARQGHQVRVLDADPSFPDQSFLWGLRPEDSVIQLASAEETGRDVQVILQGPLGVKLLSLDTPFWRLMTLPEPARQRLLDALKAFEAEAQLMLVNAPPIQDANARLIFQLAHQIAVLVPTNTLGMIDAYAVIKGILTLRPTVPIGTVVYNVRMASEAKAIAEKMTQVVSRFLGANIHHLGFLYADLNIAKSIAQREPLILSAARSKAAHCLRLLAENFVGREEKGSPRGTVSFFTAIQRALEAHP